MIRSNWVLRFVSRYRVTTYSAPSGAASNEAVHSGRQDTQTARKALMTAHQLAVWFFRRFRNPAFKPGPFPPPARQLQYEPLADPTFHERARVGAANRHHAVLEPVGLVGNGYGRRPAPHPRHRACTGWPWCGDVGAAGLALPTPLPRKSEGSQQSEESTPELTWFPFALLDRRPYPFQEETVDILRHTSLVSRPQGDYPHLRLASEFHITKGRFPCAKS